MNCALALPWPVYITVPPVSAGVLVCPSPWWWPTYAAVLLHLIRGLMPMYYNPLLRVDSHLESLLYLGLCTVCFSNRRLPWETPVTGGVGETGLLQCDRTLLQIPGFKVYWPRGMCLNFWQSQFLYQAHRIEQYVLYERIKRCLICAYVRYSKFRTLWIL